MSISHHPIRTNSEQEQRERILTVGFYQSQNLSIPLIRIKGKWLLNAGFMPKMRVRVSIVPGCLIILPDDSK
jgi:hypothetical protein